MTKLNSLHLNIAEVLMECAKNKDCISYEQLCDRVHYPAPHAVGRELGMLSEFTYDHYGIFISVLVVLKETIGTPNPTPSTGFFTMYEEITRKKDVSNVANTQREMAFNQDWSNLPDLIRQAMKSNK